MADSDDFGSGLAPDKDLVLAERPGNPDMRESASLWLFEDNGEFALPRAGIEAVGANWEAHRFDINIALAGGRVLRESGTGPTLPPLDDNGRPATLGAGPLRFDCEVPFRRWRATFDGTAVDGDVSLQVRNAMDPDRRSHVKLEVTMEMAVPAWVQDNSPERVTTMDSKAAEDAGFMGIGYRLEQLFRATGTLHMDGTSRDFGGTGLRIHRQSERPLAGFRGHCWQSALFQDGSAFGYIAYPPHEDGSESYNEGYIYTGGIMYPARATTIPWLRDIVGAGDDVSVELESELGVTRVEGVSLLSTFRVGNPDIGGLNLNQGGARYTWNGQAALGMIERSSHESLTRIVV